MGDIQVAVSSPVITGVNGKASTATGHNSCRDMQMPMPVEHVVLSQDGC